MSQNIQRDHIVGHRGAGNCAPPSTMAALEKAKDLGLEWVEFDARLTADGAIVIANDKDLPLIDGQPINIEEKTFEELSQINVAETFNASSEVHRMPRIEEALRFCIDNGLRTQIELKTHAAGADPEEARALATAVAEVLARDEFDFPKGQEPLITSFEPECLRAIDEMTGDKFETGYLVRTEDLENWPEIAQSINPDYVHFYGGAIKGGERLTEKFADEVRNEGYKLNAFKVNTREDAAAAIAVGVHRFTSDEPEQLLME